MIPNNSDKTFELSPASRGVKIFLFAAIIVPLLIVAGLMAYKHVSFTEMPIWALGLMFGIAPVILIAVLFSSKNPNAVLGTDGLKVKASFINKTWPLAALQRDSIRMLNLDENDGLKPRWRILGVSLPGLNSGLFKLRNGEKAHIYITQKQKVVYIPTQKGSILLSLEKPREFIDTLQGL